MNAYAQARNRYQDDGMKMTSPQRLVVLLYQRLMRDLHDADAAIEDRRIEDAHNALIHAQDIVLEFHLALDAEGFEGGERLADIYVYLTDRLVDANRAKDRAIIAECRSLVEPLAEAFETVAQAPAASNLTTTPA
ncbi:MAG: flagellar export chaperone FliS [Acidimicrobiia bacterium]|nr:flagellar export chaperone FliS [Acidimicrobiia bacterium]MDH5522160.1 flagellar export chaperone FliS [Acidimicrobiia bacterium]